MAHCKAQQTLMLLWWKILIKPWFLLDIMECYDRYNTSFFCINFIMLA